MKKISYSFLLITIFALVSCKDSETPATEERKLIFKFKFNPTQERLGGDGQPTTMPAGNAGQSPTFNKMCAHYIELAPNANTLLGAGKIIYFAPEKTMPNNDKAIDFSKSALAGECETFFAMPLKDVVGKFDYLRVSLAYQNYDVQFRVTVNNQTTDQVGTVASFIGYRTFIENVKVKNQTLSVNDAKLQGFWAFENPLTDSVTSGQAPQGATTVPNPLIATSPIPAGSCVVTGAFLNSNGIATPLQITGNETQDVIVEVSLSTNQSFEWKDNNANGKWEPLLNEEVVDMGIRGMKPFWK
jgi:hypothetical protein